MTFTARGASADPGLIGPLGSAADPAHAGAGARAGASASTGRASGPRSGPPRRGGPAQSVDTPTTPSRPRTERAAVRLEGVRKVFGDVEAGAGIDPEIDGGGFFSMLGPAG